VAHLVEPSGRVTVRVELDLNLSPAQQRAGRPSSSPLDPQSRPSVAESARPGEQAAHNKAVRTESSAPGERNEASQSDARLSAASGEEEHGLGEEELESVTIVPLRNISQPLPTAPGSEAEDMDMQASVPSPSPEPPQRTDSSNSASDSFPGISCDGASDSDGSDEEEAPGENLYQHWAQNWSKSGPNEPGTRDRAGPPSGAQCVPRGVENFASSPTWQRSSAMPRR
jgi:hypothetical protein